MNLRLVLTVAIVTLCLSAAHAGEIYSGEPLAEALHDLDEVAALLVSHELSSGTPLARTDVYRLGDGRLVAITSTAAKLGEPFGIETLRVSSLTDSKLTKKLPPVSSITLPAKP